MIACGQNRQNKLWKLEESHLDSVDAVGASDPLWGGLQSLCCKKKIATGQHTYSIIPPLPGLQPTTSHGPAVFDFGSGQEHFPPKWEPRDSHLPGLGDRAGALISDFHLVPLSLGSKNFILMSIMRQVKVFEDGSNETQEMGEDELPHISWWGVSIVRQWRGLGRWRLQ